MRMIPTNRLLAGFLVWVILGGLCLIFPWLEWGWYAYVIGLLLVVLVDLLWVYFLPMVEIERNRPKRFAMGQVAEVGLIIRNGAKRDQWLEVYEGLPEYGVAEGLPWAGVVPGLQEIQVIYPLRIMERGDSVFFDVYAWLLSPMRLWQRGKRYRMQEVVKVYPNYEPVIRYSLLAMQQRENRMGIVRKPRSGASREFHQLREYHEGDPLSQIDWKATSRRQALVSRAYQEQRNQSVIFLIDSGMRMRALEGDCSQFDHALNSVLLLSHIALRQGDQVGIQSFGGVNRWLPPVKGEHSMTTILNHVYDYQSTAAPSDFGLAVEQFMVKQRRRSMVVLLTNLRGEDGKELLPALQVLRQKHFVVVASLRESSVKEVLDRSVHDKQQAFKYLAVQQYLRERSEIVSVLRSMGVLTIESEADQLPVTLANAYMDIKASGRL